jgi:Uma2 family endonuclease
MSAQQQQYLTEAEYLAFERASPTKHEYYRGYVYAMTGASERHNLITANVIAALHSQLRQKPCRVYPSDLRVKVQKTGLHTYPDILVVCGKPEFTDDAIDTILNPIVIIEVLSPSTEAYDRGMKFQNYRTIETLRDYLLIAQDESYIEQYTRQEPGEWVLREFISSLDLLTLASIACTLALADVYEHVTFSPDERAVLREPHAE